MRQLGVWTENRNNPKLTHGAGRRHAVRVKTNGSLGHRPNTQKLRGLETFSYGISIIGACQNAAFCPVGSSTVT